METTSQLRYNSLSIPFHEQSKHDLLVPHEWVQHERAETAVMPGYA